MSEPGTFTALHRGGSGEPLVLLHGFSDTWWTWRLVLDALERDHDVIALALPGHPGGPHVPEPATIDTVLDLIEQTLQGQGIDTAKIIGNSLGGYLALRLAERGWARSVVALDPAGGWGSAAEAQVPLRMLGDIVRESPKLVPHLDRLLRGDAGRRNATMLTAVHYEHIPVELLKHQLLAMAAFTQSEALIAAAQSGGWPLDAEQITCPVRFVWGAADRLLPWPASAARFQAELPNAEWVVLDDVGHCPQLDVPTETAALILGFD